MCPSKDSSSLLMGYRSGLERLKLTGNATKKTDEGIGRSIVNGKQPSSRRDKKKARLKEPDQPHQDSVEYMRYSG